MTEKDSKPIEDDDDDDDDDDDYCPTKTADPHSSDGDSSEHEDTSKEPSNDLKVNPYDPNKVEELWKKFTSDSKPITEPSKPTSSAAATSKVFEFAGEKVSVPVKATSTSPAIKRPAPSTSQSVLDRLGIGKKPKLSTLEKSRLDWQSHKESEALTEDLESHRRGKDSFVEKQAFLQRSELRQHDHFLNNRKKK